MDKIDNLMMKAENITNLLKTLSNAADDLKNPVLRSKQLRRDSSLDSLSQEDNVKDNVAEYQTNDDQPNTDDGIINSPNEILAKKYQMSCKIYAILSTLSYNDKRQNK